MSGSRDKTLIKWELAKGADEYSQVWGKPKKMFTGHSHFISQLKLSSNSAYAISSSWDGTCRLWSTKTGRTVHKFIGHDRDVLSVDLSNDDRIVLTGSLDKTIKMWNVEGNCKHTVDTNGHTDAVSVVKFYAAKQPSLAITASWDKTIKVWDSTYMSLMYTFKGHTAQITSLDIVDANGYLASGSRDGKVMVWDVMQGKWYTQQECDSPVNCVLFSPKLYWLIIATETGIKILSLPTSKFIHKDITVMPNAKTGKLLACKSLAWSKNSTHLYSGWSDNLIRIYKIEEATEKAGTD